ncbi:eukaryotic translation initiation factor 3 subunit C [Caerostris extrusa]|uniref:Eukaryotic translation initiation factor 3 subunit C n=1 Tax=Caerostris extrusa TaxID=172846 RepID=A0AAV4QKN1_CAEEX|nr:eukaryotic translation initiation factor 3 subunit C [Caerostris extrusa]
MHRTEPTRIQAMSLQWADKVTGFVEQLERLTDVKQGSYFGRNLGQQIGNRDSNFQKSNYNQQDRNWKFLILKN